MTIHELKLDVIYFDDVKWGDKSFEIRFNDRDYKVGDTLHLMEWNSGTRMYTGRDLHRQITYITYYKQMAGYAVMGIRIL